jgi:division protein CdvB (Snf7/Vps24/ESCRT-III family)
MLRARPAAPAASPFQGQAQASALVKGVDNAKLTPESMANAKLKAKEWQFQLKVEMKLLDKEVKRIQKEEGRLQKKITEKAQKGCTQEVEQLAKTIVQARRTAASLAKTQSSMHAVDLQLSAAVATMSMKSALQLSAELMQEMGCLVHTLGAGSAVETMHHEMAQCAHAVHNEMEKPSFEGGTAEDAEDEERRAVAEEVQKVLEEVELEKIRLLESTKLGTAATAGTPAPHAPQFCGHGARHRAA